MIYRNPHVLIVPVTGEVSYAKNPLVVGGEQVINRVQRRLLDAACGGSVLSALAGEVGLGIEATRSAVRVLSQTGLLSEEPEFALPTSPNERKSLSLWVHTSNRCNLGCPYCYVNAEKRGPRMEDSIFDHLRERVLTTVSNGEVETVTLKIAGGEPLITFLDWKDVVADLKGELEAQGVAVHLHLLTNGTILSSAILDYIEEHDVGVGLSVDGLGATHDATRSFHSGRGSFSVVRKNLSRLRSAGTEPYITTVVNANNLGDLLSLTEFYLDENVGFRFSLEKGGSLDRRDVAETLSRCYRAVEAALPTYDKFLDHTLCDLSFSKPVVDTACGVGRSHASVNVDGAVHVCQTEHRRQPIGSVFEERDLIDVIAGSSEANELAEISPSCRECPYRYLCAGGCPTHKENRKSPYCETFHDMIPTILRLRGLTMVHELQQRQALA